MPLTAPLAPKEKTWNLPRTTWYASDAKLDKTAEEKYMPRKFPRPSWSQRVVPKTYSAKQLNPRCAND